MSAILYRVTFPDGGYTETQDVDYAKYMRDNSPQGTTITVLDWRFYVSNDPAGRVEYATQEEALARAQSLRDLYALEDEKIPFIPQPAL